MMNILQNIVDNKKREVEEQKRIRTLSELESMPLFKRNCFSLTRFLLDNNRTGIIAEFKRRSPSKGVINDRSKVEEVTQAYAQHKASGISVLTDEHFFGGRLEDLKAARINELPLLRKDFIIDEYQIIEAKAFGADVVLLIAACLSRNDVLQLASLARSIGLEVLLEVHNERELEFYCDQVDIIGVNNRDLSNLYVDIQISLDLIDKIPLSVVPVTESGISDIETVRILRKAGYKGFLMGEIFMKHKEPGDAFADFVQRLKAGL